MKSFTYYTPTRVFFGADAVSHIGEAMKKYGFKKVLLHYGGGSIKRNGLYDKVTAQLKDAGVGFVELGGVEPNPKLSLVRKGVELCKKEEVDFILGVGGGSVSDSSKGIALALAAGMDTWAAMTAGAEPALKFPMGLVLTISAAGSEMSNSCVITNDDAGLKRGCNYDQNRPLLAFMDPAATLTVSKFQTAAGAVDIMMHTMERYLTNEPDTPLTDAIAEALLRRVAECGDALMKDPSDLEARADIMWASSLAHNGLTGCGRNMTFTAHKIEHDISGVHDNVTHGAGLSVIFPAWCLHEYKAGPDRFYNWAVKVWGAPASDDKESSILEGVRKMRERYRSWGMPTTMAELGVKPDEYEKIASLTTNCDKNKLASFSGPMGVKEIIEVYKLAE